MAERRAAALETRAARVADAVTAGLNIESMQLAERTAQAVEEAAAGLRAARAVPGQQEYEVLLGLVRGLRGPHPGPEIPYPSPRRLRLGHNELGEVVTWAVWHERPPDAGPGPSVLPTDQPGWYAWIGPPAMQGWPPVQGRLSFEVRKGDTPFWRLSLIHI